MQPDGGLRGLGTSPATGVRRIAAVKPLEAPTLAPFMTAREAPRVPFSALIERGLISAGAKLVDASAERAFAAFTEMTAWWPREHRVVGADFLFRHENYIRKYSGAAQ